jgi:predicted site-specific integrase-resolvase
MRTTITAKQYAQQLGVSENKVLAWIRTGQLRALNVASNVKNRPRWKITADARREFEESRTAKPSEPATATLRRRAGYERLV